MAVNDELAAFHNHTNFGKDTQCAFSLRWSFLR